jgi:hypothetical protein
MAGAEINAVKCSVCMHGIFLIIYGFFGHFSGAGGCARQGITGAHFSGSYSCWLSVRDALSGLMPTAFSTTQLS